jgi:muramoyltetrapeptide carboxypeptidase
MAVTPLWPDITKPLHLLALSSPFQPDVYDAGLQRLRDLLPELIVHPLFTPEATGNGDPVFKHLAGTDQARQACLRQALNQGGTIMAIRGGFGVSRLLPLIQSEQLWAELQRKRPVILGFSDITALLNPMAQNGLVGLHGPNLSQLPHLDEASLGEVGQLLNGSLTWPRLLPGVRIVEGQCQGPLLGGNLSMLCHLLGTPYAPDFANAILFLEEVNEPLYCLDRLLTKLELAGLPQLIAGVALGDVHGHNENISQEQIEQRRQLMVSRIASWGLPFICALPFGHARHNRLLPVGALAAMDQHTLAVGISCGQP